MQFRRRNGFFSIIENRSSDHYLFAQRYWNATFISVGNMQRNLDLIREILLSVEAFEPTRVGEHQDIQPSAFSGTVAQNDHHLQLLIDAGFLNCGGRVMGPVYIISGMTMRGHDFLDAVREKSVWDATKNRLLAVGGWTLEVVLAVAKEELMKRFSGFSSS